MLELILWTFRFAQPFLWHLYNVQNIGVINFTLHWNWDSLTNRRERKWRPLLPPLARIKMRVILFQKNQCLCSKLKMSGQRWFSWHVASATAESERSAASNSSITAQCQPWNWIKSNIIYKWTPYFCLVSQPQS